MYVSSKYQKQRLTELKGKINKPTYISEAFNTTLSLIDRTSTQKIIRDTED